MYNYVCHQQFLVSFQTLSVAILDKTQKIVRRQFEGNDLIRNVPLYKTVGEVLEYVSEHYFSPCLGLLEPYEYEKKQGIGKPIPIAPETTICTIRSRQRHRRVGLDRLCLNGMADLGNATAVYI